MNTKTSNQKSVDKSPNKLAPINFVSGWFNGLVAAFKKSRFTQMLTILLGVQLVLAMLLGWQSSREGQFATGEPLLSTTVGSINNIEITDSDNTIELVKESGEWHIDGDPKLPVQANTVENLISTVTTLKAGLPVASSESSRAQLKVAEDDFLRRLSLSGDGVEPTTLLIGTSPGLRKSHVRREDSNAIYSASLPIADLPSGVNDWLDKSLLSFNSITSVAADGIRFILSGEGDDMIWLISESDDQSKSIDNAMFETAVRALQAMRVTGVANSELQSDKTEPEAIIELQIVSDKPETTLTIVKHGDVVTAKRKDTPGVFTLATAQYEQYSELASLASFIRGADGATN